MCRGDGFESCSSGRRPHNATTPCSNYCGKSHCTAAANTYEERRKWAGESYTDSDPIEVAFMRPQTDVYYPGPDWDWISQRLFPGSRALYGGW